MNMKRALIAATLVAVAGAVGHPTAYVTHGSWAAQQVAYYINPVNSDVSQQAAIAAIQTGADAWSLQSNADVQLYYAGLTSSTTLANNGRNEIFFRNEANGSIIASTYWWYDGSGHIVDADMVFYDGGIKFFTGSSGCSGSYAGYIEDTATHEFGHALGLRHSAVTTATMYATITWCSQGGRSLDADDREGIEAIYPAGSTSTPPAAPSSLSATTGSTGAVTLRWADQSSNETGFAVERAVNGGTFSPLAQMGVNATAVTDTNTATSTTYAYRLRAYNGSGYSSYSNQASVTTPAPTSSTAFVLSARPLKQKGTRYADLRWSGSTATQIDVYRNGTRVAVTVNDGAYVDPIGGKGGGSFGYRLCATGTTTCSNTATAAF
jgi:hypothetical protein